MKKIIILLFVFSSMICFAQEEEEGYWQSNWALGPHLVISFPQEEFANVSKTGEGIGGKVLYRLENTPFLNPRLDFTYLSYGEQKQDQTFSAGYYLVQTRNESFQLTVGPQFSTKIGRFTPYLAPMGGLYIYRTVVSVPELYYYYGIPAAETTHSLTRLGWNVNAGVMFDVGLGPLIDFSLRYQTINGAVKTTVNDVTIKSDARDFNVSIGVVFFLKQD